MNKIFACGIVPVIKLQHADDAVPLCKALLDGGVSVAEITFRTDAAEASIQRVTQELPDVLVGAGTVLTADMAEKAAQAGAKFIVTPGINKPVIEYCQKMNLPIVPGCSCPTDIETALSYGITTVKFFPAEAMGGLKALKAMSAPYGMVQFMPTGGIDASNIGEYMKFNKIVACGGSWMAKESLIHDKRFDEITRITRDAVLQMHGFEFCHMAINPEEGQPAESIADQFTKAFGFDQVHGSASVFSCGKQIEIMREKGPGACGHIAVKTNNVKRAMAYLAQNGIEIDKDTLRGPANAPNFVYLKDSFGPFKVHLVNS